MTPNNERPPRFRPGVKFRFDETRQAWVILAPEKLFLPDEIAVEILRRIDGTRGVGVIVEELAQAFQAPRAEIAADVGSMLADLAAKGVLVL
jgi:pyrroloquinoline quinone biosynthesis protein D